MLSFEKRLDRISEATHIVWLGDLSIHIVDAINTHCNDIFISTQNGLTFMDTDVMTIHEAANCERNMLKLYEQIGIEY